MSGVSCIQREHAQDMLESLPEKGLLTGDAGFVGYDFARAVLTSGRHLLIRVGANIKLLRKLAYVREFEGTRKRRSAWSLRSCSVWSSRKAPGIRST